MKDNEGGGAAEIHFVELGGPAKLYIKRQTEPEPQNCSLSVSLLRAIALSFAPWAIC